MKKTYSDCLLFYHYDSEFPINSINKARKAEKRLNMDISVSVDWLNHIKAIRDRDGAAEWMFCKAFSCLQVYARNGRHHSWVLALTEWDKANPGIIKVNNGHDIVLELMQFISEVRPEFDIKSWVYREIPFISKTDTVQQ